MFTAQESRLFCLADVSKASLILTSSKKKKIILTINLIRYYWGEPERALHKSVLRENLCMYACMYVCSDTSFTCSLAHSARA